MIKPNPASSESDAAVPATAEETRMFLIERARRSFAPIPKVFIQNPDRQAKPDRGGPLADFVQRGDKRGLTAFLLLQTIISSGTRAEGWSTTLHLQVWARALDTVSTATGASATSAATKILSRLVSRKLIARQRSGRERKVTVTLLQADASGRPYTRPTGTTPTDRFIRLNHQFWTEHWDQTLSLPAIAMLLVALHEKPRFTLPTAHMPAWYGWSADTAERGLQELKQHGLLDIERQTATDPLSPKGVSTKNVYTVLPPFDAASVDRDAASLAETRR